MKSAREVYQEIYGTAPDTMSGEFRLFCLARHIHGSKDEDHKEKIINKTPSVTKYVEEVRAHAERNNKQFENTGYAQGRGAGENRQGHRAFSAVRQKPNYSVARIHGNNGSLR